MKSVAAILLVAAVVAFGLTGCQTIARSEGPIESFIFAGAANSQLSVDVVGSVNRRGDPKSVQLVVPPGTDLTNLVATISLNAEAVITVISSGSRVVQQNGRTPNDFSVPVMYSIEVKSDKKPWTYQVHVRETDTDAGLANLTVQNGSALNPEFRPETAAYTAEVQFAAETIDIQVLGRSRYLRSISVADTLYRGPRANTSTPFIGDEMIVVIETTAEDGVSTVEYTLTVMRGDPDRNAYLDDIRVSGARLSPQFQFTQSTYQVTVAYEAKSILLSARTQSPYATLTVVPAGRKAIQADPTGETETAIDFPVGNRIDIAVEATAQDGGTQRYRVVAHRAPPDSNNSLASLAIQGIQLAPLSGAGRTSDRTYRATVPFEANEIVILAQASSGAARITLEQGRTLLPHRGDPTGKSGAIVSFPGSNPLLFAVVVTAQDGSTSRHAVQVVKSAPNSNAGLMSLAVSQGRLSPPFSPNTAAYNVSVPANSDRVSVMAIAANENATIAFLEDTRISARQRLNLTFQLQPGERRVATIVVTAQDQSQQRYRVMLTRPGTASAKITPAPAVVETSPAPAKSASTSSVATAPVTRPAPEPTPAAPREAPTARTRPESAAPARPPAAQTTPETQATQPAPAAPIERESVSISSPPRVGTVRISMSAKNLRLENSEAVAVSNGGSNIAGEATVTVRYYRTDQVLDRQIVETDSKKQGRTYSITFEYDSPGLAVETDRLIEIEVAIPVSRGNYLHYTAAHRYDKDISIEPPFLLYGPTPRVTWPGIGTMRPVSGYVSLLPPGQDRGVRAVDSEDFERNSGNEYGVEVSLSDAASGRNYATVTVWNKPGLSRGHVFPFESSVTVPEGSRISFLMTARARNGRMWQSEGTTTAWTTMLAYNGGFEPIQLEIDDELAAE